MEVVEELDSRFRGNERIRQIRAYNSWRWSRVDQTMSFYVYILASRRNGTLYIGMTDDIAKRIWQHREGIIPGFTKRYGVKMLVWVEAHDSRESAFLRERQVKKWNRSWKLRLIEKENPAWRDLWDDLLV
jgi:putative endonuclease